ncbi:MAG TPA: MaoC family dehydratase [Acidimicrobiales bacterium]|jgi:acyl dehydratase
MLSLDDLRAAVGTDLGSSPWVEVTAAALDQFAAATDPGSVPEYLALSLTNRVLPEIVTVDASAGLNVGTNSVRFPGTLAAGDRVRGRAALVSCTEVNGGVQTVMRVTLEVEGRSDPACVVDAVSRWLV